MSPPAAAATVTSIAARQEYNWPLDVKGRRAMFMQEGAAGPERREPRTSQSPKPSYSLLVLFNS